MQGSGPFQGVRQVSSNQEDIYKDLESVVRKYASTVFLRPVADHTRAAFEESQKFIEDFYTTGSANGDAPGHTATQVVLDSGCGTGESTLHLARKFQGMPVVGIDKSAARLSRAASEAPPNAFWVRAELLDFWRLALEKVRTGEWEIPYHAVYYPNPWPKQSEATRRFHLHPIFPTLMRLARVTELRTNWEIYAREFAEAVRVLNIGMTADCVPFDAQEPQTAFERKYKEARQQLWRVVVSKKA